MTPCGLDDQLSIFGKLLLIRCLCPDRILAQARKYVEDSLGPEYLDSKGLDLAELVEETERKCPLVGLISTGRLWLPPGPRSLTAVNTRDLQSLILGALYALSWSCMT